MGFVAILVGVLIIPYVLLVLMPSAPWLAAAAALVGCYLGIVLYRIHGQPCDTPNPLNFPGPGALVPVALAAFFAGLLVKSAMLRLRSKGVPFAVRAACGICGVLTILLFARPSAALVSTLCINIEAE